MKISSTLLENALATDRDFFHRFLVSRARLPKVAILLIMAILNGLSLFGGGWIISYQLYPTANIVRVFDAIHLYNGIVQAFFIFPIVIVLYLWQPMESQIVGMLKSIRKNESIKEDIQNIDGGFIKTQRRYIILFSVLAALVFILVQHFFVYPVENDKTGTPYFWYYATYYYWFLYTPILFLGYYMVGSVIIKVLFTLSWLNSFFKNITIDVHPLHPDGAGGLGSIGELSVKLSSVFVALGFLASILTIARVAIGNGWFYYDTVLEYLLYFIFVPIALIAPMWSVHKKMIEERDGILLSISKEFEKRLSRKSQQVVEKDKTKLKELNEKYKLVLDSYPTWPLHVTLFKNFSITAVIPFVTGTLSIGLDLLKN